MGRIPIAPLGEVEVGQPPRSLANPDLGSSIQPNQSAGGGDGLKAPNPPIGLNQDASPGYGGFGGFQGFANGGSSGTGGGGLSRVTPFTPFIPSSPLTPFSPEINPTPSPPETPEPPELPKLMLVLVRVTSQSNASSVDGKAISKSLVDQHSVVNSLLDLRDQP